MKKTLLILALFLAACTKQHDALQAPTQPAKQQQFFSRVQFFKDGRKPSTDTIWTLMMLNQMMVDSFRKYDGKVYWESTIAKEVGVLWAK